MSKFLPKSSIFGLVDTHGILEVIAAEPAIQIIAVMKKYSDEFTCWSCMNTITGFRVKSASSLSSQSSGITPTSVSL